jgi:hypothetical protein
LLWRFDNDFISGLRFLLNALPVAIREHGLIILRDLWLPRVV